MLLGAAAVLYFAAGSFLDRVIRKLGTFIPSVESFSATPYWDVSRYSWGYGTAAPGPNGTITRAKAFTDMVAHLINDYYYLSPKITRKLTVNQWAALLSFSYNEGPGNADNLVDDINAGSDIILEPHWKQYIYAGGSINSNLVARRNKEWALWVS